MLAHRLSRAERRGIVLVLVLAMLGLLALIGVTFATFAGQARINARNFAQSLIQPQDDELMDYALSQLINDTADPRSVIRGHSLARDMYGGDANNNRYLTYNPVTGGPLLISSFATASTSVNAALVNITTNIPTGAYAFYGYGFTRWIMRVSYIGPLSIIAGAGTPTGTGGAKIVDQTLEILIDNASGTSRVFQVAVGPYIINQETAVTPVVPLVVPYTMSNATMLNTVTTPNTQGTSTMGAMDLLLYNSPKAFTVFNPLNAAADTNYSNLNNYVFTLDSRWLNAFNGTGMQANANFGNFRYNGLSPAAIGMDEDYDACDLENWFLAIQSADGQVIIPSFHRPANVRWDLANGVNDWQRINQDGAMGASLFSTSASRILRPVFTDGNDQTTFPDLHPDPATGKIGRYVGTPDTQKIGDGYDVDNDGDGITDSVWLDLGYPARRDSRGQLYKPLFSFMVIGLNGRIPLNTAGNLAGNSSGTGAYHAAHLGNSPSEIDPSYALQNATDGSTLDLSYAFTMPIAGNPNGTNPDYSQVDNATTNTATLPTVTLGPAPVDVRLTQLRNLLAGARPQPTPTTGPSSTNGDQNFVLAGGPLINYYMPNGVADYSDTYSTDSNGNLYVENYSQAVAGRWGESQSVPGNPINNPTGVAPYSVIRNPYNNPVRAGYSEDIGDILAGTQRDAADDNYNSFDFYPTYDAITGTQRTGEVDDAELYDPAGAFLLPIDRIRRWVTPADINGTGLITTWSGGTAGRPSRNTGPDLYGRIEYASYFRPPGAPAAINVNYNPALLTAGTTTPLTPTITGTTLGAVYYPSSANTSFYTVGLPPGTNPTPPVPTYNAYLPDVTNNPLHGFESFKVPNLTYGGSTNTRPGRTGYDPQDFGGMPIDENAASTVSTATNYNVPSAYPTYDFSVNSKPSVLSDGLNEADEMNLYTLNAQLDSPYGPSDFEWLYRQQDVDGASLSSRLAQLAPISFTNSIDGLRRRRLFALDAWETNNFVWANDNPGNVFPNNSTFSSNPAATAIDPASGLKVNIASPSFSSYGAVNNVATATPSLAHRDKKINLNYPLPVSNDPSEPVRQKWINDTYQVLKRILPPRAVDTPDELAQLSQFIVNIVDFRDPDCTMTHFQNPDVVVALPSITSAGMPAVTTYSPPVLYATGSALIPGTAIVLPLDQFGMEYNPVAINEAMAVSYMRAANTAAAGATPNYVAKPTPRFFFELVNTLTQAFLYGLSSNASTLDLGQNNFDIVITTDDPASRPDPFLGQLMPINNTAMKTTVFGPIPLVQSSFSTGGTDLILTALPGKGTAASPSSYYNVTSNAMPTDTSPGTANPESSPITPTQTLLIQFDPTDTTTNPTGTPPTPAAGALTLNNTTAATINGVTVGVPNAYPAKPWMPIPGMATEAYYWLCLRRPASLFLPPNPDPTGNSGPYNPMIVVDSMRFPYIESGGTIAITDPTGMTAPTVTTGKNAMYSVQRAQPYRGGHAVRLPTDATIYSAPLNTAYGYSEQSAQPATDSKDYAQVTIKGVANTVVSLDFYETLGGVNDQSEPWDWMIFNDRDFTSVAELMFVPGCPPGLFTKQFVELPPMVPSNSATWATVGYINFPVPGTPVTTPPVTPAQSFPPLNSFISGVAQNTPFPGNPIAPNAYAYTAPGTVAALQPHTYPYLVDKFFYTGASLPVPIAAVYPGTDTFGQSVNGPASDGWFKMLDFFEVPSPSFGSIGAVAAGTNFDWARQDTKPGLLNLNLIIDEEVFLSVLGKQTYTSGNGAYGLDQFSQSLLNFAQIWPTDTSTATSLNSTTNLVPLVATSASALGTVNNSYSMWAQGQSGGVLTADWLHPQTGAASPLPALGWQGKALKASFSQFLTLRHGGSGYLFNFNGERPFHSLSYPDIDYTVMRPATLPPASPAVSPPISAAAAAVAGVPYVFGSYAADPGVRNLFLYTGSFASALAVAGYTPGTPFTGLPNVVMPEPVPARRLFQAPDAYGLTTLVPTLTVPPYPIATPPTTAQSNASDAGDPFINVAQTTGALAAVSPAGSTATIYSLNNGYPVLTWSGNAPAYQSVSSGVASGATRSVAPGNSTSALDYRQHPNWRLEMLQRVMNETTVRTHQYAVWITIGFFEVIKVGDLGMLASATPQLAFDIMGSEVGAVTGNSVRYRGFFLVDRTKLTGFNPGNTGSFRSAVVYRKVIQ